MFEFRWMAGLARRRGLATAAALALTLIAGLTLAPAMPAAAAAGAVITVDIITDMTDANDGDCSLREAIIAANTNAVSGPAAGECPAGTKNLDRILINTTPGGEQTLALTQGQLPNITKPVVIDASTQGPIPSITLDGVNTINSGFVFAAGSKGSKLIGFRLVRFALAGVELNGGGVTLQRNYIGFTGSSTPAANFLGVRITSSNNRVGALSSTYPTAPSNVISGNTWHGIYIDNGSNNIIQSNWIGLGDDGVAAVGNGLSGIFLTNNTVKNTQIGGTKPGQGNVISSGGGTGIQIESGAKNTRIQRNFIGTDAFGLLDRGNISYGIYENGGLGTLIGGAMPAASNLIAANEVGVYITTVPANATISGNVFGVGSDGISPLGNDWHIYVNNAAKVTVKGNLLRNATNAALEFSSPGLKLSSASTMNCIQGNVVGAVYSALSPTLLKFNKNWWGDASGPTMAANPSGTGQPVTGPLTVTKWLKTTPTSCLGFAPKTFSPKDMTFGNKSTRRTKFTWGKVPTANNYQITLNTTAGPVMPQTMTGTVTKFITAAPLDYGGYSWQTTTETSDGIEWLSPVHKFYVTIMKSPKPGAEFTVGTHINLTWRAYQPAPTGYVVSLYSADTCLPGDLISTGPTADLSQVVAYFSPATLYWSVTPNGGPEMPCWPVVIVP